MVLLTVWLGVCPVKHHFLRDSNLSAIGAEPIYLLTERKHVPELHLGVGWGLGVGWQPNPGGATFSPLMNHVVAGLPVYI